MLALLVLLSLSPDSIDPPPEGHFARDLTGRIAAPTLAQLDAIARDVDASGAGQLGVAVVPSTSGEVPRAYATRVFNHWGIGNAGANDGLLLFVALDDHKAEIIIGDGLLGGRVTTAQTDAVMAEVVSHFKSKDPNGALLAGARRLAELLHPAAAAVAAPTTTKVLDALQGRFTERSPRSWIIDLTRSPHALPALDRAGDGVYAQGQRRLFFVLHEGGPSKELANVIQRRLGDSAVVVVIDRSTGSAVVAGAQLTASHRGVQQQLALITNAAGSESWDDAATAAGQLAEWSARGLPMRGADEAVHDVAQSCGSSLYAWPVALLLGGVFGFRRWSRYRPRTCECGRPRQLLSAYAEKVHLNDSQQTEESLGSVDYDVWWCALCKNVWINDNVAWFSRYSCCPQCNARTRSSSTTTLHYATEDSTGLEEITETCQGCNYTNRYTRTTAQLSSSSSSDSDWSSSSSSSSDSFGGGSSSGGGSSGSW